MHGAGSQERFGFSCGNMQKTKKSSPDIYRYVNMQVSKQTTTKKRSFARLHSSAHQE